MSIINQKSVKRSHTTLLKMKAEGEYYLNTKDFNHIAQAKWSERVKNYLNRTFKTPQNYADSFELPLIALPEWDGEIPHYNDPDVRMRREDNCKLLVRKWMIPLESAIERVELELEKD